MIEPCDIEKELYLGAVILIVPSAALYSWLQREGGVEIEKVAEATPEKILTVVMDPLVGIMPYQGRDIAFALGLNETQVKQFTSMLVDFGAMMMECDLSMLEINPLVITKQGNLLCLDANLMLMTMHLYRQPEIRELRDASQEDERENRAREWELNYIALDGDVGCMVNGAGLAMATMDMIKTAWRQSGKLPGCGRTAQQRTRF